MIFIFSCVSLKSQILANEKNHPPPPYGLAPCKTNANTLIDRLTWIKLPSLLPLIEPAPIQPESDQSPPSRINNSLIGGVSTPTHTLFPVPISHFGLKICSVFTTLSNPSLTSSLNLGRLLSSAPLTTETWQVKHYRLPEYVIINLW